MVDHINKGHYTVASEKTSVISALAAIPKDDDSIRIIHDGEQVVKIEKQAHSAINRETGPFSNLTNKMIRNIFDKLKNHGICAAKFRKQKNECEYIEDYFSTAHKKSAKESQLRLLHFKFIQNIYPTNILLNKMGLATTNKCPWSTEIDYIKYAINALNSKTSGETSNNIF